MMWVQPIFIIFPALLGNFFSFLGQYLFPYFHSPIFFTLIFCTLPTLCFFGRFSHILLPFVICALPGESIAQTTFNSQIGRPCSSPPISALSAGFHPQRGPVLRCTFALLLAKTHRWWSGVAGTLLPLPLVLSSSSLSFASLSTSFCASATAMTWPKCCWRGVDFDAMLLVGAA